MEMKQQIEWQKAQKIVITEDLVAAAKQHLRFLAEVDRNQYLYGGPILDRAIYRYKNCWMPLLAKYADSVVTEGPLVVPLDCEWIWHCHRLNPVRYKTDCEEIYGKILGNQVVASAVQGVSKKETEKIWSHMFPDEPYELDINSNIVSENASRTQATTKYDLHSAVGRQRPFYYQVSRPHMKDDVFLRGAVARYKGFLHLIRTNMERGIRKFCVPTHDIDLIWHSHQLMPISYCKDLETLIGKVLMHDDTDSYSKKLHTGFCETTEQWEETFGFRYWRAGAMSRGNAPTPLTINLSQLGSLHRKVVASNYYDEDMIKLPQRMSVEVMVEIVAVKNLPDGHHGRLFIGCSKKQTDKLFHIVKKLKISSETGEKEVATFRCEPTGELVFELISQTESEFSSVVESLGTVSISIQDCMKPDSELWIEKWFPLVPNPGVAAFRKIHLHIGLSFASPIPAPYELQIVPLESHQQAQGWTEVVDETGKDVIKIQMRDSMPSNTGLAKKEMIGMNPEGKAFVLAESFGAGWSLLMDSNWLLKPKQLFTRTDDIYELTGDRKVIIFPGRKLEFESNCENQKDGLRFMTVVEFSEESPGGKAVGLLDFKLGSLKVNEKWLLLPGIILAFLLPKRKGYTASEIQMTGNRVPVVGEITHGQNKEGYCAPNVHKNMVKKVSLMGVGSCGIMWAQNKASTEISIFPDHTTLNTTKGVGGYGSAACYAPCGGLCSKGGGCSSGCSSCSSCGGGGECGAEAANGQK